MIEVDEFFYAACEGITDEPVVVKLLKEAGITVAGSVFVLNGKSKLDVRLSNYNCAARHGSWFVLRDLDSDTECAPDLIRKLLPSPAPRMYFRIAVREVEAWLLADREKFAKFFGVDERKIPANLDSLPDPKGTVVGLCGSSSHAKIRKGMVPEEGSGWDIGPAYTSFLMEYVRDHWRMDVACKFSNSLAQCCDALKHRRPTPVMPARRKQPAVRNPKKRSRRK